MITKVHVAVIFICSCVLGPFVNASDVENKFCGRGGTFEVHSRTRQIQYFYVCIFDYQILHGEIVYVFKNVFAVM
jgi:hypothetical protein